MYKYYNRLLPDAFEHYFTANSEIHHYGTRQAKNFHMFTVSTATRKHSIGIRGPKLWNNLNDEIKSATSCHKFKSQMKAFLVNKYS